MRKLTRLSTSSSDRLTVGSAMGWRAAATMSRDPTAAPVHASHRGTSEMRRRASPLPARKCTQQRECEGGGCELEVRHQARAFGIVVRAGEHRCGRAQHRGRHGQGAPHQRTPEGHCLGQTSGVVLADPLPQRPREAQERQARQAGEVHADAEDFGIGEKRRGERSRSVALIDGFLDELAAQYPEHEEGNRREPQPAESIHASFAHQRSESSTVPRSARGARGHGRAVR